MESVEQKMSENHLSPTPSSSSDAFDVATSSLQSSAATTSMTTASAVNSEEVFQVGHLTVKNSIFSDILNDRKLELFNDPDILALLANSKKKVKTGKK